MKRGGILLNVSRGAIWDEKAVYQALQEGRIGAAAGDVLKRNRRRRTIHFCTAKLHRDAAYSGP